MFTTAARTSWPALAARASSVAAWCSGHEVALQVDRDDGVPVLFAQVDEHPVAQDARVVHEHVQVTEGLERRTDEPTRRPSQVATLSWLATASPPIDSDLGDDLLGRAVASPGAVEPPAEVVDDDLRALGGEEQGVLAADAPSRTGDDRDASVECTHDDLLRDRCADCTEARAATRRRQKHGGRACAW